VTDAEDQHDEPFVFKRADKAVVSDLVFPELAQGALKTLTDFSRIV
jgi:hypothetical protein